jgi:hypothetical protein
MPSPLRDWGMGQDTEKLQETGMATVPVSSSEVGCIEACLTRLPVGYKIPLLSEADGYIVGEKDDS